MNYIALNRRFASWDDRDGAPVERLVEMHANLGELSWSELRKHRRVVILAEAGSGKSEELREQAREIGADGSFAFCTTVRDVARQGLPEALASADRQRLAEWQRSELPAWLFVDSVDEAKLDGLQLRQALQKIGDALASQLRRIHIVLSGRVSDWEFRADLSRFADLLPVPAPAETLEAPGPDVILGRALRGDYRRKGVDKVERAEPPLVVLMAALDEERVRLFAAGQGIADLDAFIKAVNDADLWFLARRPLDLQWLVTYWRAHGRFGSLAAMIEVSLQERLRETNPHHAFDDSIDAVRAMRAVERVGAALVFGRLDKIAVEDSSISLTPTVGMIRLEDVLPDWPPADRRRLSTRPVFDPATYGCVRLHNDNEGTVRAFLAARWLERQRAQEGSARTLLRRLVANTYGYALVKPSLELTCAWLSLWDADVARAVISRSPELLLAAGDPGSLSAASRASVLTHTIEALAQTGVSGTWIQDETLRRLSTPDLAPTVRALWGIHLANPRCRNLLLRVIALGSLSACADVAANAASGVFGDTQTRVFAGRALMATADPDGLAAYAAGIRANAAKLPGQVLWEAIDHLFARELSVGDFLALARGMDEPTRNEWPGLDQVGPRCAARLTSRTEIEEMLGGVIAILANGEETDEDAPPSQESGHLPLLGTIAAQLMGRVAATDAPALVIDVALKIRGANRHRTSDSESRLLIEKLGQTPERRRTVFWHIARAWADHRLLQGRPLDSVWAMSILGWPSQLQLEDLGWLLTDATNASTPGDATLAVHAALDVWQHSGKGDAVLARIRASLAGQPALLELVDRWLTPARPSAEHLAHEREMATLDAERVAQEAARDESWVTFRAQLQADPDQLRHLTPQTADNVDSRLYYLWQLLSSMDGRQSRYAIDDVRPVELVLGAEVTRAFRDALVGFWRQRVPTLESSRAPDQRNVVSRFDCIGICGVSVEANLNPSWPTHLTPADATRAAEFSTLELNGFPAWTSRLAVAWPAEVSAVLIREVVAEMDDATSGPHAGPLQDLEYGAVEICRCVSVPLHREFRVRDGLPLDLLSKVLVILCRGLPLDAPEFVTLLVERAKAAADLAVAACYFGAAFHRAPVRAEQALSESLTAMTPDRRKTLVEALLPRLYGDAFRGRDEEPLVLPLEVMERLVAIAFGNVRVDDDAEHKPGVVFSRGPRDEAERSRDALFGHLCRVPGPATIDAIRRIGRIPGIPLQSETVERLCRERAAADSEGAPWPPGAAYALERAASSPPASADDLQALVVSRLEDIADDLRDGDFTQGTTVKRLQTENEVQRWVANELRNRQGHAYSIEREPHVAGEKAPDIRLRAPGTDASVPIEIKDTAGGWSLADLRRGLSDQLCGRYLRARDSHHGIYLIVHRVARSDGWRSTEGKAVAFDAVIANLHALADSIAAQSAAAPRVRVCVIDVSAM